GVLLQYPRHGFSDELLVQYFYQSLVIVNKGLVDIVWGSIVKQPLVEVSRLLNEMTKINQTWYTIKDYVSLPHLEVVKKQEDKNKERDKSISKLIAQLEMLYKCIIGGGENSMNAMSWRMYNNVVYMRGGKLDGLWPGFQGLPEINECEDAMYMQPFNSHDSMKTPINDLLTKILNKLEGSNMILQGMKSDVLALSTTVV
ncbi:hypothetical protein H5410_036737, partial [Solanum commersonii]